MTWSSWTVSAGTGLPPISRTGAACGPAMHYGGEGRSLEAGLCGDEIPSWCAALHSAFLAILSAASKGPRTVYKKGSPLPVALSTCVITSSASRVRIVLATF